MGRTTVSTGRARNATLQSIAAATGVSRQTVSNVLNDPARVAPATRRIVEAEIRRVGYRPSAAARQLRTRRSGLLGYRMHRAADGINGTVLDRLLHAVTARAADRGYRVLLFEAADDEVEIARFAELRATYSLDGFLLTSTARGDRRPTWLAEQGIPFVVFGRPWGSGTDGNAVAAHDWVDVDGRAGTLEATRSLLAEGARKIAFVGWPEGSEVGDDRHAGYRDALIDAGEVVDPVLEVRQEDGVAEGAAAAASLMERGADAFVCVSDTLALGVAAHLRIGGRPDLLGRTIGFDDTPVAQALGLSSVDQPLEQVAQVMVDRIVARIETSADQLSPLPQELLPPTVRRR
ncbi:LacI family DNA-binding transcriptional regulator [Brachybacterium sp. EF45031]|uniref:LacI family DNA-binding transcriptional regulator n=1 Tax=Brachybacterium sillae TaxID=2810536 RepID=UPI00217D745E|nr:LacI family DNA-binding transcriptional regulator [Brachybacterium sillae]MCS6711526.1 LacI family DNA-binding transcriptional regulator [Brachybacterium sillae]